MLGCAGPVSYTHLQQPDTLKFFSEMLGKMTIRTKSTGMSNGGKSGSNANYSNTAREDVYKRQYQMYLVTLLAETIWMLSASG